MARPNWKPIAALGATFLGAWLGLKYLLPLLLPFLLGTALALAAEPAVRLLHTRLRLPRGLAAPLGVSLALVCLLSLLLLLGALLIRELRALAGILPDLEQTAVTGLSSLESYLLKLSGKLPPMLSEPVSRSVRGFFSSGTVLVDQLAQRLPALAGAVFSHVPGSALTVGTGILSGFMISARMPRLRRWLRRRPFWNKLRSWRPAVTGLRTALGGWIRAQLKLCLLCFGIVTAGLLLLRVSYAPLWGILIALVDAVPVLGTGTVLLPWSFICLVQGNRLQALGLLLTYLAALIARTVLEPRLVGRQLGLDPLMTLAALYAGFRIWGVGGMLLAPLLCVAAGEAVKLRPAEAD